MTIDRRSFIGGAGLTLMVPALPPWSPAVSEAASVEKDHPALMIDGWSVQSVADADKQLWMRVGQGWRTVWR